MRSNHVPAAPARAHLLALREAGVGYSQVAKLAGLSPSTVGRLLWPVDRPVPSVLAWVADAILGVRPGTARRAEQARIDGTGTARRVQALVALGWSFIDQAAAIGWGNANYRRLADADLVRPDTARAVARLYDRWSMRPAPDSVKSLRARRMAARRGWVPPLAWDDDTIDDHRGRPGGAARQGARSGAGLRNGGGRVIRTTTSPMTNMHGAGRRPTTTSGRIR